MHLTISTTQRWTEFTRNEVLITLTNDANKLMSKMLAVHPSGNLQLIPGLRVAHLALKHRQVKRATKKLQNLLFSCPKK